MCCGIKAKQAPYSSYVKTPPPASNLQIHFNTKENGLFTTRETPWNMPTSNLQAILPIIT